MIKVALAGTAHIHRPDFVKRLQARADEFKVKVVWDNDRDQAQRVAAELGAGVVAEPAEIWRDGEIDAVMVLSETILHEQLVLAAAAAGKHLFVEKPLGMGADDAFRMANAIEDAGVLFQTGYFMRGQPEHLFLKEHIERGSFGKISRIRHSNCHQGSLEGWFDGEWRWMADPVRAGVGAFGDLGTHSLDILMWLMGEVTNVTSSVGIATGRYGACDEYGEALMRFSGGALGTIAAGWVDVANPILFVVSGTKGHAHLCDGALFFTSELVDGADGQGPWLDLPEAEPHAFEKFLDRLTGDDEVTLVSPDEAAARSAVMEAIYRSSRSLTWSEPQRRSDA